MEETVTDKENAWRRLVPRWFRRRKKTPGDQMVNETEPSSFQKAWFDPLEAAAWVLPDLDDVFREGDKQKGDPEEEDLGADDILLPDAYEVYKQRGFLIAVSNAPNPQEQLDKLLADMLEQEERDLAYLHAAIDQYRAPYKEKFSFFESIINQLKERLAQHQGGFASLLAERDQLFQNRQEAYAGKWKTEEQVAEEKKNLLGKWIEEAKQRIKDLLQANLEILQEKQRIASELYEKNKTQNDTIAGELRETRDLIKERLTELQARRKVIAGEGYGKRGAKFLVSTGALIGVAAGLFFSVFTLHGAFGSEDLASFIFNALLEKANKLQMSDVRKVLQLLEVLGILSLASLLCRSAIIHIRRQQTSPVEEDKDEHYLQLKIRNDNFKYNGVFRAGNWPLMWFKLLPLILLIGSVIIFIAQKSAADLNDSMGGLVMGTLVASGVSAFCYLYIVKIIEPRLLRKELEKTSNGWAHLKWIRHWELVAVFFFFITVTLFITWYVSDASVQRKDLGEPAYRFIALLWFLAVTLLCGFVVAYGIRYQCIGDMEDELLVQKLAYDDLIDHFSGVVRSDSNYRLGQLSDELMQKLLQKLIRRNNVIFNNPEIVQVQQEESRPVGDVTYRFLVAVGKISGKLWRNLLFVVREIIMPAAGKVEPPVARQVYWNVEEMMVTWEVEFFADLYHSIGLYDNLIKRYTKELEEVDGRITGFNDVDSQPLVTLIRSLEKAVVQQAGCNRNILYGELVRTRAFQRIKAKYLLAMDLIKKGFQTGSWYKGIDPDISGDPINT